MFAEVSAKSREGIEEAFYVISERLK